MGLEVDRAQVLAYRTVTLGLDRRAARITDLEVLDLGVQDMGATGARTALAARLDPSDDDPLHDPELTLTWSLRGAPHLHRTTDLPALAAALWPASDTDAMARLVSERKALTAAGIDGLAAWRAVTHAERDATAGGPVSRSELSTTVTRTLPAAYRYDCRACGTAHVYGNVFQLVGLHAGIALIPDARPATLSPVPDRWDVPEQASGTDELIRTYLRVHGPATLAEAAALIGTTQAALRWAWPDDLVAVTVDGQQRWLSPDRVDALREASPLEQQSARLLPPADPWLQARDRELLIPDADHRKAVWRMGGPGVLWVDGEVAGTWRAKATSRRLDVTLFPFTPLPRTVLHAAEQESQHLARARGRADASLAVVSP